jgi:hypothetical protein
MATQFIDPSHELDLAWIYGGVGLAQAIRTDVLGARTGSFAVFQWPQFTAPFGIPTNFPSWHEQAKPAVPGQTEVISAWVQTFDKVGTVRAQVSVDGIPIGVPLDVPDVGAGWTWLELGSYVASAGSHLITLKSTASALGHSAQLLWDDASADSPAAAMAKRSRWIADQALVNVLKGINGPPNFHLDFGQRVGTRMILPDGPTQQKTPYICLPLMGDAPKWRNENNFLVLEWIQDVWGFVGEPSTSGIDSLAKRDCYYAWEDITLALLQNPTLGDAVQSLEILDGGGCLAGIDSKPWGQIRIPLKLTLYLGADVLGP